VPEVGADPVGRLHEEGHHLTGQPLRVGPPGRRRRRERRDDGAGTVADRRGRPGAGAGLRATKAIAEIAAAAGIPCHAGTSIESPIGTAASLHLACAAPAVTWGSELFGPLLMSEELLTTPLRYADGELHLPDGPALGVELDPAAVQALTRR
jgi:enolase-like protein